MNNYIDTFLHYLSENESTRAKKSGEAQLQNKITADLYEKIRAQLSEDQQKLLFEFSMEDAMSTGLAEIEYGIFAFKAAIRLIFEALS